MKKTLAKFFAAFAAECDDIKAAADNAFLDLFPRYTRRLAEWLNQFGIYETAGQTESDKRSALDAAWKAKGSLSPSNLQTTLQNAGFDVYVHEWWDEADEPATGVPSCPPPRDPNTYLTSEGEIVGFGDIRCGVPEARCGNEGARCGALLNPRGYPLVNKVTISRTTFVARCGASGTRCGTVGARCGHTVAYYDQTKVYELPTDPLKFPFFVYVGGQTFPDFATVPAARRDEFERMLLKYRPAHLWVGVLVSYT